MAIVTTKRPVPIIEGGDGAGGSIELNPSDVSITNVLIDYSASDGIHVADGSTSHILNTTITNSSEDGIYIDDSDDYIIIENCTINNSGLYPTISKYFYVDFLSIEHTFVFLRNLGENPVRYPFVAANIQKKISNAVEATFFGRKII